MYRMDGLIGGVIFTCKLEGFAHPERWAYTKTLLLHGYM